MSLIVSCRVSQKEITQKKLNKKKNFGRNEVLNFGKKEKSIRQFYVSVMFEILAKFNDRYFF